MDSNHYTGVFFDSNEQSLGEVQSLDLYSVNEIQGQAVHANPMPIRTPVDWPERSARIEAVQSVRLGARTPA